MKKLIAILLFISVFLPAQLSAQFKLMRFDEDYATYKDSAKTFYNSIKYLRLYIRKHRLPEAGRQLKKGPVPILS